MSSDDHSACRLDAMTSNSHRRPAGGPDAHLLELELNSLLRWKPESIRLRSFFLGDLADSQPRKLRILVHPIAQAE